MLPASLPSPRKRGEGMFLFHRLPDKTNGLFPESIRLSITGVDVILEACVLTEKGQFDLAGRAVSLLADDDLGRTLVLAVFVIDFVAVYEQDHIRILFDGAGFAQVGHHRALVG